MLSDPIFSTLRRHYNRRGSITHVPQAEQYNLITHIDYNQYNECIAVKDTPLTIYLLFDVLRQA